ncbi:head maturation protease, ClpP-related [Brevibacterium gallinarum]|uniref:ATP-dependent Clp protease proteolytic subunit n=1 Tax=Brevibacterium gallinarum TaxID=2762220 RepID=A0ABR8WQM4_9MICO|nr:head maturation protease, ClpP-related [Brevibacterium gallinarum]MBD8019382.1 ATP-dependent Clp protease proteolytic subunit [Brevibacterium gallinarum]
MHRRLPVNADVPDWYALSAQTSKGKKRADVYLYEAIGGWFGVDARSFVDQLRNLDVDTINLYVNSPGGDVFDGIAIYNALRRHKAKVHAVVDGIAASAASFIVQAADTVVMNRGATMMIHDAWGFCLGNASDMADTASMLNKASDSIADIYAARTGVDAAQWRDAMREENWYTADEAVTAKLADRVDEDHDEDEAAAKASFDLSMFAHAGRDAAPEPFIPTNSPTKGARPVPGETYKNHLAAAVIAAKQPPAEPVEINEKGADSMSDTLLQEIGNRLGIPAGTDLTEETALAALDEALKERADDQPAASIPDGTVLLDSAEHDRLRRESGELAAIRQAREVEAREQRVDAAIADGKIPPARRDHWLAQLAADAGAADVLDALAPGTIPTTPAGFTGGIDESTDEDLTYAKLYTKEA